jgi:hypothetical protein
LEYGLINIFLILMKYCMIQPNITPAFLIIVSH